MIHQTTLGLKKLRTGADRTSTAPKAGSRTQKRKAALRSYTPDERKNGRNK